MSTFLSHAAQDRLHRGMDNGGAGGSFQGLKLPLPACLDNVLSHMVSLANTHAQNRPSKLTLLL